MGPETAPFAFLVMPLIESLSLGRFCPGNTPLHRLSPGLKLIAFPASVIASFACTEPLQLLVLACWALLLAVFAGQFCRVLRLGLWQLRYLFLATILLHALLSPGRTLVGVSWISLDGLLFGSRVVGQLALAVTFSSLLTATTPPMDLVGSLEKMLSPLRARMTWPREVVLFLSLVLYFIPVLREEVTRVRAQFDSQGGNTRRDTGILGRARTAAEMVQPLVFGLIDRADSLAIRLSGGEPVFARRQLLEIDHYSPVVQVLAGCAWGVFIGIVVGGLR